ncbi:MAG: hypothetical protein JNM27_14745 [Leptospirales bacterium]|nr:hypothetical protein [Leptospirales bacterium]
MTQEENPNASRQMEASVERAFRRGNINFDFLQPGQEDHAHAQTAQERRGGSRQGKRGLFNRGRPARPVGRLQIYAWATVCALSALGLGSVFVVGKSLALLLALPLLFGGFLWSIIMLTLFLARPR